MDNDSLSKSIQNSIQKSIKSTDKNPPPFLRYIGGKKDIAKELLPFVPNHEIYAEPFMGSAAFFFKKEKAQSNVINDFNGDLVNLFMQVRDRREDLLEYIWLTPLSEEIHKRIFTTYNSETWFKLEPLKRALGYFYLLQLAYNESVGNLGNMSYKIEKGKQKWSQDICDELFACSKKLDNVIITNRHYQDLINFDALNKPNTFWYFDPPYTMADGKGYYKHNFLPSSHHEFFISLKAIQGKFMVSYDDHEMIRDLFCKDYAINNVPNYPNEIIITNYEVNFKEQESII